MSEPTRILAEGRLRYWGAYPKDTDQTCRVFIVDWMQGQSGQSYATVVLREPAYFQNEMMQPLPVGTIRHVYAGGGDDEVYLTVDVDALVPA